MISPPSKQGSYRVGGIHYDVKIDGYDTAKESDNSVFEKTKEEEILAFCKRFAQGMKGDLVTKSLDKTNHKRFTKLVFIASNLPSSTGNVVRVASRSRPNDHYAIFQEVVELTITLKISSETKKFTLRLAVVQGIGVNYIKSRRVKLHEDRGKFRRGQFFLEDSIEKPTVVYLDQIVSPAYTLTLPLPTTSEIPPIPNGEKDLTKSDNNIKYIIDPFYCGVEKHDNNTSTHIMTKIPDKLVNKKLKEKFPDLALECPIPEKNKKK